MPLKSALVVGATGVVELFVVVETLSKARAEPATVPASATLASALAEAFDTVNMAERKPAADGVLATATVQSTV
jgi:hypothetical protein